MLKSLFKCTVIRIQVHSEVNLNLFKRRNVQNTDVLTCLIGGGGMHKTGAAEVAAVILVLELRALHQPGGVAYGADQSALALSLSSGSNNNNNLDYGS